VLPEYERILVVTYLL